MRIELEKRANPSTLFSILLKLDTPDAGSYAWVVFKVDGAQLRASGFLPGIKTPADLPIGSKVRVTGYDAKHGLMLQK